MSADAANDATPPAEQRAQGRFGHLRKKLGYQLAPELPTSQRWALAATLLVGALIALGLAVGDFMLATTGLLGTLLAAILLALAIVNLWSLHSLIRKAPSWQTHAAVAQALIAFLALYVIETAKQNPQPRGQVEVVAALVGIVAVGWVARLAGSARVQWNKTATTIVAVIPLAGFVQFGLQSDFIPTITGPLIDLSTTLSPTGRTGQHIQVSATAVIHNRGTQKVYVAGELLRVMAYPYHPGEEPAPTQTDVKRGLDLAGATDNVFDIDPIPPADGQLVYAAIGSRPGDSLDPGETDTVQRVIDIGLGARLVRFTIVGVFFASREIHDIETCGNGPSASWNDRSFADDVDTQLCMEYVLEPRNIIEAIVGPRPVLRVWTTMCGQDDRVEYPEINWHMAARDQLGDVNYNPSLKEEEEIAYANPAFTTDESSEYAPTDKDRSQAAGVPTGPGPGTGTGTGTLNCGLPN